MRSKNIHVISYPNISLLDLAGPIEVFLAANHVSDKLVNPYALKAISLSGSEDIFPGLSLSTEVLSESIVAPDILVIPGGPGIHDFCRNSQFLKFVNYSKRAKCVVSVCTGVFALATLGRLEGKRVTTHWSAYDRLEAEFPNIIVERGPIFINDGDVWTSAGVTSGIDLALAIVEEDLGHSLALKVAQHLIMFLKRPGDQKQFSSPLMLQSKSGIFSDLHAWVRANLNKKLSLSILADHVNMTERTFLRKYTSETGMTPRKMIVSLRLESACEQLTNTANPIKEIVQRSGFGSESNFSRQFEKAFGISPREYRIRFNSKSLDQ